MSQRKNLNKSSKKGNRVQVRVHEFVKKLQPDNIKSRLSNVRKFLTSTSSKRSAFATATGASASKTIADNREERKNADDNNNNGAVLISSESEDGTERIAVTTAAQVHCEEQVNNNPIVRRASSTKFSDDSSSVVSYFNDYVLPKLNSVVSAITKMERDNNAVPNVVVLPETRSEVPETLPQDEISDDAKLQPNVDADQSAARNKSPVTVQEWVDSLPLTPNEELPKDECELQETITEPVDEPDTESDLKLGAEAGLIGEEVISIQSETVQNIPLATYQEPSDVESHCSSVDSLLDARKPDPEEILLRLGFGGSISEDSLATGRIPKRFLRPSKMKGVDIEEFIRQQQDMIQTYESGYSGYRGLTGPSYSNPSVIVSKIMEKLKDHRQETEAVTASMYSIHHNLRRSHSTNYCAANKFSRAARNVLTKIRCSPGSVLTPDNRKWLESQGQKSPEISRRIIIGQQSFTFGRDGDLIESPASSLTTDKATASRDNSNDKQNDGKNNDRAESSLPRDGSNSSLTDEKIETNKDEQVLNQCNNGSLVNGRCSSDSSKEEEDKVEKLQNEKANDTCFRLSRNPVNRLVESNGNLTSIRSSSLSSLVTTSSCSENQLQHPVTSKITCRFDNSAQYAGTMNSSCRDLTSSDESFLRVTEVRCDSANSTVDDLSTLCLEEELKDSGVHLTSTPISDTERSEEDQFSAYRLLPSSETEQHDEGNCIDSNFSADCDHSENLSAEKHAGPTVCRQYKDLMLLTSKLQENAIDFNIGSENAFTEMSSEQRRELQSRTVREAINTYINKLGDDGIHSELKNCLNSEARKLFDLVDTNSVPSKLSVIVQQMTLLLQNQSELIAQIRELASTEKKPTACNEMCDHILKRVQELEQIVQQSAQELAEIKSHMRGKHDASSLKHRTSE